MEKSMNKIIDKTEELVVTILKSDMYTKYIELKNKMCQNKEIMDIIDEIKSLQKKIINETYKGKDVSLFEEKISKNMELLNNCPIYVEFNYLQEDLNEMFQHIKNTIQSNINSILN